MDKKAIVFKMEADLIQVNNQEVKFTSKQYYVIILHKYL